MRSHYSSIDRFGWWGSFYITANDELEAHQSCRILVHDSVTCFALAKLSVSSYCFNPSRSPFLSWLRVHESILVRVFSLSSSREKFPCPPCSVWIGNVCYNYHSKHCFSGACAAPGRLIHVRPQAYRYWGIIIIQNTLIVWAWGLHVQKKVFFLTSYVSDLQVGFTSWGRYHVIPLGLALLRSGGGLSSCSLSAGRKDGLWCCQGVTPDLGDSESGMLNQK